MRRGWTQAEIEDFVRRWCAGEAAEAMAAHFQRSRTRITKIASRLRKAGLDLPNRRLARLDLAPLKAIVAASAAKVTP